MQRHEATHATNDTERGPDRMPEEGDPQLRQQQDALPVIELALDHIREDGGTQPRVQKDVATIAEYQADMERGATFEAIDVFYDGTTYWLVDGFHRVAAARQCGFTTFAARVHQGTQADAQWFSFGVNAQHGLRRSPGDKQRIVRAALLHPHAAHQSNRAIARHCQVNEKTVRNVRDMLEATAVIPQSSIRTGADGRVIDTQNIGQRRSVAPSLTSEAHENLAQVTPDGTTTTLGPVVVPPQRAPSPTPGIPGTPAPPPPGTITPRIAPSVTSARYLVTQHAIVMAMLAELTAQLTHRAIDPAVGQGLPQDGVAQAATQVLNDMTMRGATGLLSFHLPEEVSS